MIMMVCRSSSRTLGFCDEATSDPDALVELLAESVRDTYDEFPETWAEVAYKVVPFEVLVSTAVTFEWSGCVFVSPVKSWIEFIVTVTCGLRLARV
jgi:hypothetical protein